MGENKKEEAGHNGEIGNIEDCGSQSSQAEDHEIDDDASLENAIDQVTQSASQNEREREDIDEPEALVQDGEEEDGTQRTTGEDGEQPESDVVGELGSDAHHGARVLRVLQMKNMFDQHDGAAGRELAAGKRLGRLVAPDAENYDEECED